VDSPPSKAYSLGEIADHLSGTLSGGDPSVRITGLSGIREARSGEITFLGHPRYLKDLEKTGASAVVAPREMETLPSALPVIRVPNAYYAFAQLMHLFFDIPSPPRGISRRAAVDKKARLGRQVSIGPFVYVGKDAVIGDGVILYPGVYVGNGVVIGDGSLIYPHVTLREGTRIGRSVIIHGGSVLGSDGFGFVYHEGEHHKIPQLGGVVIEDEVEIGANVTIDRGTLGDTIVRKGTKIDNLVQIGHNVVVGEHSILVAQAGISGSVEIGNRVTLAGQAGVAGHLRIGERVRVGAKAGITKDVPPGETVSGFPAIPHREWLKAQAVFYQLPLLKAKISELEKRLSELERTAPDRERDEGGHS
jgi:UDP-3-O-[3-hydroxymyristoyl] glucosamine N-acyltransferase